MESGLLEPHREGPGEAMDEYPDDDRLDSEAMRSAREHMEKGDR